MPLVGSTAYGTAGSITSLVRSLLNDSPGNWATDTVLLPYLNSAYRTCQRKIANAGGGGFVEDNIQVVVSAVPAAQQDPGTQVVLNDASAPPNQLPANLLIPLKLRERPNGSAQDFDDMVNLTNKGGLPSRIQGPTLDVWEWRTDGIYFIGATQDTQIDMRYQSAFPDLSGPTDVVLIRGAQEALAYGTAGLAGLARGSPLAEQMENLFTDVLEDLVLENVRANQVSGVRRRAYGSRSGARRGRMWPLDSP
jgi:hypothetical protein